MLPSGLRLSGNITQLRSTSAPVNICTLLPCVWQYIILEWLGWELCDIYHCCPVCDSTLYWSDWGDSSVTYITVALCVTVHYAGVTGVTVVWHISLLPCVWQYILLEWLGWQSCDIYHCCPACDSTLYWSDWSDSRVTYITVALCVTVHYTEVTGVRVVWHISLLPCVW